jgi:hypothetical protein
MAGISAKKESVPCRGLLCFGISSALEALQRNRVPYVEIPSFQDKHRTREVGPDSSQCITQKAICSKNISVFPRFSHSWFKIGNACEKYPGGFYFKPL